MFALNVEYYYGPCEPSDTLIRYFISKDNAKTAAQKDYPDIILNWTDNTASCNKDDIDIFFEIAEVVPEDS